MIVLSTGILGLSANESEKNNSETIVESENKQISGYTYRESYDDRGLFGSNHRYVNIQMGARNPIGKLKSVYGTSLFLGVKLAAPIQKYGSWYIDFGCGFVIPSGTKQFEYTDHGETFLAKPTWNYEAAAWIRKQNQLAPKVYFNKYLGIGFHGLKTDQYWYEDEEFYDEEYGEYYTEEVKKYYGLSSVLINAGADIRY